MIRFLLDEHVNPAIQRQLRRLNLRRLNSQIDVLRVGEADAPRPSTIHSTVGELTRGEWFNPFAFFIFAQIKKCKI